MTASEDNDKSGVSSQRLDKWLWFARVIKTRTQAAALVTDGKVRINRQRTDKPSLSLKPGDVVTVTVRGHIRVLKVLGAGERRGPPAEARQLFEELTEPSPPKARGTDATAPSPVERASGAGRPTKRDRRLIDRLTSGDD